MSFRAERAGRAALAALRAGPARVFASFERSCYVETRAGIACVGADIGLGPLNAVVERFEPLPVGAPVELDLLNCRTWFPGAPQKLASFPEIGLPDSIRRPAGEFLAWISGDGERAPDELIGLGPGLTPAGDDFVGGAMIALRAAGDAALADRVAAWALPLARERTSRISRAHLECAAAGEGHEYLHEMLLNLESEQKFQHSMTKLARIGHTSGLDAAAGALHALGAVLVAGR